MEEMRSQYRGVSVCLGYIKYIFRSKHGRNKESAWDITTLFGAYQVYRSKHGRNEESTWGSVGSFGVYKVHIMFKVEYQ